MPSLHSIFLLPPALLALLPLVTAQPNPTALRKLPPDSSEKLFPEHLAFAPLPNLSPDLPIPIPIFDDDADGGYDASSTRFYRRAFAPHYSDDTHDNVLRRAAEALAILERRSSCPAGMSSCADIGSPNKCCQEGTYCTDVPDTDVGHVACCPRGSTCDAPVGECPSDAVSCPAELGGGCCISGYICQGVGCVRPGSPTTTAVTRPTETEVTTTTEEQETSEEPTSTESSVEETAEETETATATATTTETATATGTGGAPWRPTMTSGPEETEGTQTGCPTGFYGCLATHGGGCCRTDRNCETHSCPPRSSTTIVSGAATVVVPADDVPASATETCADGWFLCGKSGGPTAGCCPSGYECGTASCFTVEASQTGKVQKEFPKDDGAAGVQVKRVIGTTIAVGAFVALVWVV